MQQQQQSSSSQEQKILFTTQKTKIAWSSMGACCSVPTMKRKPSGQAAAASSADSSKSKAKSTKAASSSSRSVLRSYFTRRKAKRDWSALLAEDVPRLGRDDFRNLTLKDVEAIPASAIIHFTNEMVWSAPQSVQTRLLSRWAVEQTAARQEEAAARQKAEERANREAAARQEAEEARQVEAAARQVAEEARQVAEEARQVEAAGRQKAEERALKSEERELYQKERNKILLDMDRLSGEIKELFERHAKGDVTVRQEIDERQNQIDAHRKKLRELTLNAVTEGKDVTERQVRDVIHGKPILSQRAQPEWNFVRNPAIHSPRSENFSTKSKAAWLRFMGENVVEWADDEFVRHLESAPQTLVDLFLGIKIDDSLASQLDGRFLTEFTRDTFTRKESVVEIILDEGIWDVLRQLSKLVEKVANGDLEKGYLRAIRGDGAVSGELRLAPQYNGLLKPDHLLVASRYKGRFWSKPASAASAFVEDLSQTTRRYDLWAPLDPYSTMTAEEKQEAVKSTASVGFAVLEVKPDVTCPIPAFENNKDIIGEGVSYLDVNRIIGQGLVEYLQCENISDGCKEIYNPVSQVGTYAVALGLRFTMICTLNSMTYGVVEVETDNKQPAAAGSKAPTSHRMKLTRKFDWASPHNPIPGKEWSHWEILFRFMLATIGKSALTELPDTFKAMLKAPIKQKGKQQKFTGPGDRDDDDSDQPSGPKDDNDQNEGNVGGDHQGPSMNSSTDSKNDSNQSSGTKGTNTRQNHSAVEEEFGKVYWADLWDERRFAVPATHSLAEENTSRHLPGDAKLLGRARTGPAYRKCIRGRDVVVKVALVHDLERDQDGPTFEDLSVELKSEADIYAQLKVLQGVCVPRFLWQGDIHPGFIVGLVTDYAGVCLENVPEITPSMREQAVSALDAIHSQGVIHGDIRLANLVVNDEGRVFVIDFGASSSRKTFPDDDAFRNAAQEERATIISMIAEVMREEQMRIQGRQSQHELTTKVNHPPPELDFPVNKHGQSPMTTRKRRRSGDNIADELLG